MNTHEMNTFQ